MDSIISWVVITIGAWYGIVKFFLLLISEHERRLDESEKAWGDGWN